MRMRSLARRRSSSRSLARAAAFARSRCSTISSSRSPTTAPPRCGSCSRAASIPNTRRSRTAIPMLVLAARNGSAGAVDALLAGRRRRPNARNPHGDTRDHGGGARRATSTIVRKLRAARRGARRAGLDAADLRGDRRPRARSCATCSTEGAHVNAASPNGTTALMMAVREHRVDIADLLLAQGRGSATGATTRAGRRCSTRSRATRRSSRRRMRARR